MITAYTILLIIHVAAGSSAILTGGIAILTKKGGKAHKKAGKLYYYGMIIAGLTGIVTSIKVDSIFLLAVAVFTLHSTWGGNRSVKKKKGEPKYLPLLDKIFMVLSVPVAGILLYLGIKVIIAGNPGIASIPLVFGLIVLRGAISQIRAEVKGITISKKEALLNHIGQMGGAYIATITAFLANNVQFSPQFLVWLGPTIIGVPLLILATRKWRKKLYPKGRPVKNPA